MVTETQELVVFNCVVKHASYARAAEELSLSASGVSRIVTRMEERLGARLVQRTTRKLSLTEAGAAFHARTSQILTDLADAEAEVQKTALQPQGVLRVTAAVVFGHLYLAPMLGELLNQFPKLSLDLLLTNRFVDLIEEGMDLAIRIGQLADSRLIARRLCTNHRVLVASPSYIERWGMPERPEDLHPPPVRAVQRLSEAQRMEADRAGRSGERCRRGARRHEQRRDVDQRRQAGPRHHGRRDAVRRPGAARRGAGARSQRLRVRADRDLRRLHIGTPALHEDSRHRRFSGRQALGSPSWDQRLLGKVQGFSKV